MSRRAVLGRTIHAGAALAASLGGFAPAGPWSRVPPPAMAAGHGESNTLTLVTNRTPSDLDPHSAYDAGSGVVLQGPFEGLIRLKAGTKDEYVPLLAASWEANPDQSQWTFHLREGVTFQNGDPLDAFAARASFERLLTLGLAPSTVLGRFLTSPDQIEARDATTLVFDLGQPQPLFATAMTSAYGTAIVNVAALREHEVDGDWGHAWAMTNSDGIGTGPYQIVAFDVETGVILEPYAAYWGAWDGQHFARVVIRVVVEPETRRSLIESGDADIATTLPLAAVRDLEQRPDLTVDHRYNLTVRYLAMTVAGPLQSPEARQALCWAFPYDEVITGVLEGLAKPAVGPVAELCRGFDPTTFVYTTDLDKARELLGVAGIAAGTHLTLLLPPGNVEATATAELLGANLAAIGLVLDIDSVDFATYVGIILGDLPAAERPHLFPLFWQPDYNDAWNHLWPQVSCAAWQSGNAGHYCNERVEALLEEARDATDEATYFAALGEIQDIVTREDPAAIYHAQPEWLTVLRRDVGGYVSDLVVGEIVDFYALYRDTTV